MRTCFNGRTDSALPNPRLLARLRALRLPYAKQNAWSNPNSVADLLHDIVERRVCRRDCLSPAAAAFAEAAVADADDLSAVYEAWLDGDETECRIASCNRRRKRGGVYYTPNSLAAPLIDETFRHYRGQAANPASLPTVYDPACGAGNFLLAAARKMSHVSDETGKIANNRVRVAICERSLFGTEIDAGALAVARFRLWVWAGMPRRRLEELTPGLVLSDALRRPLGDRQFDIVVGNPPFANAIEGGMADRTKSQLRREYPELGGTADLSFYFLALAHRSARPQGAVGLVLPRNVLTGRAAEGLRKQLLAERPPSLIQIPASPYCFSNANVFVVLLALSQSPCTIRREDGKSGRSIAHSARIETTNWWAPVVAPHANPRPISAVGLPGSASLGERFDVFASMTTGMAYELSPFVAEASRRREPRLVTTGLIEPARCEWGIRRCRYLKRDFAQPVIRRSATLPSTLAARLDKVARPKVLVAGLSNRVEAMLDVAGDYVGSVGTFTILDAADDIGKLSAVCDLLNSPAATTALFERLGANAMGGGRITLNKHFLRELLIAPNGADRAA